MKRPLELLSDETLSDTRWTKIFDSNYVLKVQEGYLIADYFPRTSIYAFSRSINDIPRIYDVAIGQIDHLSDVNHLEIIFNQQEPGDDIEAVRPTGIVVPKFPMIYIPQYAQKITQFKGLTSLAQVRLCSLVEIYLTELYKQ